MQTLTLTRAQWNEMLAHVAAHPGEEVCGLVGGVDGRALRVTPVENVLHSPVAYHMDDQGLVAAVWEFERAGWDLLAIYHSHPLGPSAPSETDVRQAYYPDSLYLIFSPAAHGGWQARAFQIDEGQVREAEVILEEDA